MDGSYEKRHGREKMMEKQEEIVATDEWIAQLSAMPFVSKVRLALVLTYIFNIEKRQDCAPAKIRFEESQGRGQKN